MLGHGQSQPVLRRDAHIPGDDTISPPAIDSAYYVDGCRTRCAICSGACAESALEKVGTRARLMKVYASLAFVDGLRSSTEHLSPSCRGNLPGRRSGFISAVEITVVLQVECPGNPERCRTKVMIEVLTMAICSCLFPTC